MNHDRSTIEHADANAEPVIVRSVATMMKTEPAASSTSTKLERRHAAIGKRRARNAAVGRNEIVAETLAVVSALAERAAQHGIRIETNPNAVNAHTRFYIGKFMVGQYWPTNQKLLIGNIVTFASSVEQALERVSQAVRNPKAGQNPADGRGGRNEAQRNLNPMNDVRNTEQANDLGNVGVVTRG